MRPVVTDAPSTSRGPVTTAQSEHEWPSPDRCTATLRASFHLRPRAVVASIGPELPAGTEVAVLALSNVQRTDHVSGARPPVLAKVRVVATGQEGYAFVAPTGLSALCPLLSGVRPADGPIHERLGHAWRANYALDPGTPETPPRLLTGWSSPFDPARDTLLERVDLDHNGAQETLFRNSEDSIHTLVLWRGTRGTPALVLTQEWDHDHHSIEYDGSVHAGRAVYFAVRHWSIGTCAYSCRGADCDFEGRTLYRLHPDGYFVEVARVPTEVAGEPIELRGEDDGNVLAVGRLTHRTQRLRWDGGRFALVPDGEQMPTLEEPESGFCTGP